MSDEREVIYRIKLVPDQSSRSELGKLKKEWDTLQDGVAKKQKAAVDDVAKQQAASERERMRAAKERFQGLVTYMKYEEQKQREIDRQRAQAEQQRVRAERAAQQAAKERYQGLVAYMKFEEQKLRDLEKAEDRVKQVRLQGVQIINETGEGVLKVARGLAAMGLVSQENNDTLLRWLVALQSGFDILSGTLKIWKALNAAAEHYRDTQAAITVLDRAMAFVGGAGSGAERGLGGPLTSALSRGMGAAGGFLAGAAGTASGAALIGGLPAIGGLLAISNESSITGMSEYANSWMNDPVNDFMARNDPGLMGMTATNRMKNRQLDRRFTASQLALEQGQGRAAVFAAGVGQQAEAFQGRLGSQAERAQLGGTSADRALAAMERQKMIQSEIAKQQATLVALTREQETLSDGAAGAMQRQAEFDAKRLAIEERLQKLQGDSVESSQQELELRKQIKDQRVAAMEASIQASDRELASVKERIATEEAALSTAKQRFGQMSDVEQSRLIAIKQKADQQGAASLTKQEAADLRRLGLESTNTMAAYRDEQDAKAAGFDKFFGQEEQASIAQKNQRKQELTVAVKTEREIQLNMVSDHNALTEKIVNRIKAQIEERDKLMMENVEKRLAEEGARKLRETSAFNNQRNSAMRGNNGRGV